MSDEHNPNISKTGVGLTLLTCLLAALGFFVLQRLGDNSDSLPIDVSPTAPNETYQSPSADASNANSEPQNLQVQGSDPSSMSYPQTTLRPIWVSPQQDTDEMRLQRFNPTEPVDEVGGPSLFDSRPIDARQNPEDPMRY